MPKEIKNKTRMAEFFSQDIFFRILLGLAWCNTILVRYLRALMMRIPFIGSAPDVFVILIFVASIALAIPYIVKKIKLSDVCLMLAIVFLGLVTYVFYPDNIEIMNEKFFRFLITVLPFYVLGVCMNIKKVYKMLYVLSIVTILARIGYFFIVEGGVVGFNELMAGDMYVSYNMLPHVCLVLITMLKKSTLVNISVSVAGIIFIFSLGSRGPLICLLVATVSYLLLFKKFKHGFISRAILMIIAVVLVISFESLMIFLSEITANLGMSTRVFDLFAAGDFLTSHGRDVISETLYEAVGQNALLGYGLYGDWLLVGVYAHSLPLELWINFGVVVGTILLLAIVLLLLVALKNLGKIKNDVEILITLIATAFVKLFISNTIMEEPNLFLLIGICVSIIFRNKRKESEPDEKLEIST